MHQSTHKTNLKPAKNAEERKCLACGHKTRGEKCIYCGSGETIQNDIQSSYEDIHISNAAISNNGTKELLFKGKVFDLTEIARITGVLSIIDKDNKKNYLWSLIFQDDVEIFNDSDYIEISGFSQIFRLTSFLAGIHPATWGKIPPAFENKALICRILKPLKTSSGLSPKERMLVRSSLKSVDKRQTIIRGGFGGFILGCIFFSVFLFGLLLLSQATSNNSANDNEVFGILAFAGMIFIPLIMTIIGSLSNINPKKEIIFELNTGKHIKIYIEEKDQHYIIDKLNGVGIDIYK